MDGHIKVIFHDLEVASCDHLRSLIEVYGFGSCLDNKAVSGRRC